MTATRFSDRAAIHEARDAGFDVKCLADVVPEAPRPLLLDRLAPDGHTILFGTGDTGKGVLSSDWIARLEDDGRVVLVLDYEDHRDEWTRRLDSLGGALARANVYHVVPPWKGAIWDHADELRRLAKSLGINYVVIDSIVVACRGNDPIDSETPGLYKSAIDHIGVGGVLSLGHVTKADDLRYPFGSIFWHNLARVTWSAKKTGTEGHRLILQHRKHNNYAPMGRFLVTVEWIDNLPREVRSEHYSVALADRIEEALADKPLTVAGIVTALNDEEDEEKVKANSVRTALRRGITSTPQRFTVSGEGQAAEWSRVA